MERKREKCGGGGKQKKYGDGGGEGGETREMFTNVRFTNFK